MDWKELPDHARVWIYQTDRPLSTDESASMKELSQDFVDKWSSHGSKMKAAFSLQHERFLIFFADERQAQASGCSIDSSVHFVQSLEEQFDIDFFNRMRVVYRSENGLAHFDLPEVDQLLEKGTLNPETMVFDCLLTTKSEFSSSFEKSFSKTWLSRYLAI
jgi:hypothetical protein